MLGGGTACVHSFSNTLPLNPPHHHTTCHLFPCRSVYHLLKFSRNCPSWGSPDQADVVVIGKSAVSHDDTTTYTSDVVRLCTGGRVWVEIPDLPGGPPCCPIGDEQGTFISAFLVAETSCHWPPDITMSNMKD